MNHRCVRVLCCFSPTNQSNQSTYKLIKITNIYNIFFLTLKTCSLDKKKRKKEKIYQLLINKYNNNKMMIMSFSLNNLEMECL